MRVKKQEGYFNKLWKGLTRKKRKTNIGSRKYRNKSTYRNKRGG